MKYYMQIVILLVIASVAVARVTTRNKFEEGLLKLIEKWRDGDIQSLSVLSLRPFKIPPMEETYDGFTMSLSELKIKGMEHFTVERLSASPSDLTLKMEILIPTTLSMRADRYHLRGKVFWLFSINDKGTFRSYANNLRAKFSVQFGAEGNDTVITDLNLDYSVGNIEVSLTGSSGLVNNGVKDRILKMINDDKITNRIQNKIIDLASQYLQGHTPQEFVEIVSAA